MADDNSARYRSNEFGRGPAPAAPASDPLAELARLIGQSDPFSEYGREPRAPAQPDAGAAYGGNAAAPSYDSIPAPPYGSEPAPRYEPAPQQYSDPAPRYSEPAPQYGQDPGYSQPAAPRYAADYPPRYAAVPASHDDWPGSPPAAPAYPASAPFVPPQQQYAPPAAPPSQYDSQGYANPNYATPNYHGQAYADPRAGFGPPGFPAPPDRQGYAPPLYPAEPEAGGMPPPHDDEFYDDEPRGRRKGLLTVLAVLGLAVLGTVGAFGYRSIFGGQGSSGPPPVIRASGEPSKVAPPPAAADVSVSKFSYDRFGDAGKDEQVVRREEKPVDLTKAAPPARTVFPGAPAPGATVAKQTGSATTAGANPPSAIGEPRRVRTVPIRPDQGDAAGAAPSQQPTSVIPPRQANAAATADDPPARPAAARAPAAPRAVARSTAPQAIPSGNAPLSLSPEANNATQSIQDSFPPPPRASAPPTRIASAPASGGGSYLVQVSSQKSEADAESAYRSLRAKYSSVLGSHPHQVRRADLGSKGVYYRAMVGPFGSREAAIQVCSSLKQAGGDCVVQQ
jgi:hypothetical protein